MRKVRLGLLAALLSAFVLLPSFAFAQGDTGDTAWVIVATALVLFMTLPGLAMFYGGLVRVQNVLSVLMHWAAIACAVSILWLVCGYSLAFSHGGEANALVGGLSKAFLNGIERDGFVGTIPEPVFFMFQMTFAIITPALIVGGVLLAPWLAGFGPLSPGLAAGVTPIHQFGVQALGVLAVVAWSAIASFVILKAGGLLLRLRVSGEVEREGLDISVHGERAYNLTP